jgi:hypothetical protein
VRARPIPSVRPFVRPSVVSFVPVVNVVDGVHRLFGKM